MSKSVYRTVARYDNYVGVPRGIKLLDQHVAIALGSIGGRKITFSIVNDASTLESIQNWMDENDIQAYRANKTPEWVTQKVEELFGDEITDEDGEKIVYRGEDYTDKSRYSDRQLIERDLQHSLGLDNHGRDDRIYFVAFLEELKAE